MVNEDELPTLKFRFLIYFLVFGSSFLVEVAAFSFAVIADAPSPESYFQALRANSNPSDLATIQTLEDVVLAKAKSGVALLFYDFADSQLGLSHMRMIFNGKAYEMDNIPDSNGHYIRERDIVASLIESRPGALPSAILWRDLDEKSEQALKDSIQNIDQNVSHYSLWNKLLNSKNLNCAGFAQEALFKAGIISRPLSRLAITPARIYRHFKNNLGGAVELKAPSRNMWQAMLSTNLSLETFFPKRKKPILAIAGERMRFVLAQQQLSAATLVRKAFNLLLRGLDIGVNLPKEYDPARGEMFDLVTLQIPLDELPVYRASNDLTDDARAFLFIEKGGRTYLRFFIHPAEVESYHELIERYPKDSERWLGIPTSVHGDIIVVNAKYPEARTGIELSLVHGFNGINPRIIDSAQVKQAVVISDLLAEIRKRAGETIAGTSKTWEFFPESFAAAAPLGHSGGFIFRDLSSLSIDQFIVIPMATLVAKREFTEPWLNEIFRYSGHPNKVDFIWEEMLAPLVALNAEIEFDEGIALDLNPKNVNLKIDPKTRKIVGFLIGETLEFQIDHSLRVHRLGRAAVPGSLEDNARDLSYGTAQGKVYSSYRDILKGKTIRELFSDSLEKEGVEVLLEMADQLTFKLFHQRFPEYTPTTSRELQASLIDLNTRATSAEESEVYSGLKAQAPRTKRESFREWLAMRTEPIGARFDSGKSCQALFFK